MSPDLIGISEIFKCERDHRLKLPDFDDTIFRCRDDDNRGGMGLFIKVAYVTQYSMI